MAEGLTTEKQQEGIWMNDRTITILIVLAVVQFYVCVLYMYIYIVLYMYICISKSQNYTTEKGNIILKFKTRLSLPNLVNIPPDSSQRKYVKYYPLIIYL